jgi:hypothetical protein
VDRYFLDVYLDPDPTHVGKSELLFTFTHSSANLNCLSFSSFSKVSSIFQYFGQYIEMFKKTVKFSFTVRLVEMDLDPAPDPDLQQCSQSTYMNDCNFFR